MKRWQLNNSSGKDVSIHRLGKTIIQQDKYNDRIYLIKLSINDLPGIFMKLNSLCKERNYSKIIGRVPLCQANSFFENGYTVEASIPGFYNGNDYMLFVAKYLSENRKKAPKDKLTYLEGLIKSVGAITKVSLDSHFSFRRLAQKDISKMAEFYRKVNQDSIFPIRDRKFLRKTMYENAIYYGIWDRDTLVALSSAKIDTEYGNVEMVDLAVLPEYRGNGLALYLLERMETEMKMRGLGIAYSTACLNSPGLNRTFLKAAYRYGGTLINNAFINGEPESMNVWYKQL